MKEKAAPQNEENRLFLLLCFLIIAAAAFFRTKYLFGALEYDEIWSMENFTSMPLGKIFTELALPNNQPLNSLWIKCAIALGLPIWGIRLHSLFAALLTLPLAGFISYTLSGKNKAAFAGTLFFLALSLPDAVYASLARGYALQVFFLTLYGAGLTDFNNAELRNFFKFLPETALIIGGVGAILTLPTSVVYLGAITLAAYLTAYPVKLPKSLLFVLAGGGLFTLAWCLGNYEQLNAARVWGTKISSLKDYLDFLSNIFSSVFSLSAATAAATVLCLRFRKAAPLLLIIILPLLSAAATNAGPPRTYIPFCTATAIAAGWGTALLFDKLKKNQAFLLVFLLGIASVAEFHLRLPQWHQPDSREIFQAASRLPYNILVVHRATSGYPLVWNNRPQVYDDFVKRLLDPSSDRELLMFDGPGRINGNDSQNSEVVITQKIPGTADKVAGADCRRYRLKELTQAPQAGDFIIAVMRPVTAQVLNLYLRTALQSNISFLKLNPWLNDPESSERYALLAGKVPADCNLTWDILLNSRGAVSVYKICP